MRLGTHDDIAADEWDAPLTSPKLTGTLQLGGEIRSILCRLLDLPSGLRFSKIIFGCRVEDAAFTRDLMVRCSDTLESLCIDRLSSGAFPSALWPVNTLPLSAGPDAFGTLPPTDLSKAMKLKHADFHLHTANVQWIVTALQTVKSKKLCQITIHSHIIFVVPVRGTVLQEWRDLNRLLVQLWFSHSIRPKFTFRKREGEGRADPGDFAQGLLPELTSRGMVDLVLATSNH